MKAMMPHVLLAALLAGAAPRASGQELLAWPAASPNGLRMFLPGMPLPPVHPPIHPPIHPPLPVTPPRPQDSPVQMSGYRVTGTVRDSAAELAYDITFHNPSAMRMEGVLLVPLPADAVLSAFTMTVGGRRMNAELLESGKAAQVYENIVRQMRDPGLLELVGERLLRARVFPIEPNSDVVVHIALSQLLAKSGELYSLSLPMKSARMTGATAGRASASLTLASSSPLRTIYSPQAGVAIRRTGPRGAAVSYEEGSQPLNGDLKLFFSLQEDPLAAGLLTFKERGEDGYFMLTLSPKPEAQEREVLPKDIVFILDRSGSMADNGKLDQAKAALSYCISKLSARDRFDIVDFATDSGMLEPRLVAASAENKARAQRYVSRIEAAGGTNIESALRDGLGLVRPADERIPMVFFLTDGLPTVGDTRIEDILAMAAEKNKRLKTRLFTFGVGDDVNTLLLDKLAETNRGAHDYVAAGESIENKVSTLYQKVSRPALSDVSVSWKGVEAVQVYPRPVADIFYGGELVLMGRYKGSGKGSLTITGKASGKEARFTYPVELPAQAARDAFLPKLWANLKVAHELDAIRLSGRADPEVIETIVKLAKRYGIVTPYTSYLITEEGRDPRASNRIVAQSVRGMAADAMQSGFSGGAEQARVARKASAFLAAASGMGEGGFASAAPAAAFEKAEEEAKKDLADKGQAVVEKRSLADKTFYLRGGTWTDSELESGSARGAAHEVRFLSEDYFRLLAAEPGLRRFLALGHRVSVLWQGVVYNVVE